ncbi:MAG: aspartate aminotransferase family protein [Bryobacterales bacterium]|nr:aspartate aminotransferase family protein [Acidobacteriota bacterium]MCB9383356.1 aspartate aminotransferase family protein [Bryobacterales bacterium]
MTKDEILLAQKEFLFPAVITYFDEPLVIDHAKDQYVWDVDGNKYLDFFGGIVTVSVGHRNPKVTDAIHEQADKLHHVSTLFPTEPQVALAKRLAEISPERALTKSFFTNSGTEANETAISLARIHTGNTEIVALRHSYHGRSEAGRALTGHSPWRSPLPPAAGFVHAHNAYCYRCPFGLEYPSCELRCATDMKELIETSTSGKVAGLIAEPIQGVGGFITPPKEFFSIVVDIVKQHGGIFICDEVQTGWGRTGSKWFGIEHYGVTPDVMTFAKGLANGLPIGGTTAKPEVADSMRFLTLSTFGGNPLSMAAAKAVIDYVEEENLMKNCEDVGGYLRAGLESLQEKYPIVGEVRGMGLMQAIELVKDRQSKEPAAAETRQLMDAARREGMLVGRGGLYGNVIRISPPMNVGRRDVDEFLRLLDLAFAALT